MENFTGLKMMTKNLTGTKKFDFIL